MERSSAASATGAASAGVARRPFAPGRAAAVARRIVRQVLRDPRSLAMVVAVPVLVILLLGWVMRGSSSTTTLAVVGTGDVEVSALPVPKGLHVFALPAETSGSLEAIKADGVLTYARGSPPRLTVQGDSPSSVALLQAGAGQISQILTRLESQPASSPATVQSLAPAQPIETTYIHGGPEFDTLDYEAPVLVGFFAFFFVFLLTAVSFLRERTTGTLERLLISPMRRLELVSGYMVGFGIFALVQSCLVVFAALVLLRIHTNGNVALVLLIVLLLTLLSVNLGIVCSTFARTELQAMQFIPVVLVPQALLSGLLFAVDSMPRVLQWVAWILPLTYANEALRGVMIAGDNLGDTAVLRGVVVLAGFVVAFLSAAALTLREEIA